MKKRSKIIVGILVLFLVMAVGYAIFSQTLKINGTATANGSLDLTYECAGVFEDGGGTGTCKIEEDKSITTTSTLTKPTEKVSYWIDITNTGSIPVVLKTANSPNKTTSEDPRFPTGALIYIDTNTCLAAKYMIIKMDSNGSPVSEYISGDTEVENANITLQPKESILVNIIHVWADSNMFGLSQPEIPEGGASISYNLTFGFEQVTT